MFYFSRLTQIVYALGLSLALALLLWPSLTRAQGVPGNGVSGGWRGTIGLPTIAFIGANGSFSASGAGGTGFGGVSGSGSASGSSSTSLQFFNPAAFLPNGGRLIMLPPPTFMFPAFNALTDTTGLGALSGMAGIGMGGVRFAAGSAVGGAGGIAGGFGGGIGGGIVGGGLGMGGMGMGGMGMGGMGMGGFAGKGMGFNGRKAL